jgi:hypothetical protein
MVILEYPAGKKERRLKQAASNGGGGTPVELFLAALAKWEKELIRLL